MPKNKIYLHILLVLSIIGSGTMLLSNTMMAIMLPDLKTFYEANAAMFPEQLTTMFDMTFAVPRLYYALSALLAALSLAGVIMMWNLRAAGFHCYTLAQLLMLIVPVLFLGSGYVSIGDIMLTVLFVVTYWLLLRSLGVFGGQNQTEESQDTDLDGDTQV
ncbi:MAG: hypothetical protein K6F85_03790 [Bacteroidales bacterium]|nr:hypothetical protein [Bacteroidales bacterium]